ncbi:MAG: DUF433 domain-containing protein [Anaerolineae bacterium]
MRPPRTRARITHIITDTRVALDSVVLAFLDGLSPETIAAECFPTLTLEEVYGAITYYLAHRSQFDAYLKQSESDFEASRQAGNSTDTVFSRKLAEARRHLPAAQ